MVEGVDLPRDEGTVGATTSRAMRLWKRLKLRVNLREERGGASDPVQFPGIQLLSVPGASDPAVPGGA